MLEQGSDSGFAGRVIVITGAGRGLGAAYARHLATRGARIIVNDVGASDEASVAEAVTRSITDAGGSSVADQHDISTEAGAEALIGAAIESYGRLDGIVNNAGILRSGPLVHLEAGDWDAVHRVHLRGTFLTLRAGARWWRTQHKDGHPVRAAVVNTTSAAGLHGFLGEPAYSAAKAGIIGLSYTAAGELARYGVRVNMIAPVARTRLTAWMPTPERDDEPDPLDPQHVAPVVAWLLDDPPVTGAIVEAGNGRVAVVDGWRSEGNAALPPDGDPDTVDRILRGLLEGARPPVGPLRPELPT